MTNKISKIRIWAARMMSGFVILFMMVDSINKYIKSESVVEGTLKLGYSEHHIILNATLGLLCTILYAFPRTSMLGAVVLTGYFGGAIASHMRIDDPLFAYILFPFYLAVLTWGGIWLRNEKVRKLIPFQNKD
ncbi:DoxX family protein [Paenibacillus nasutitermitis]|uniref:DoxX family protein n=1 Tax=Paenibacillus nasutitermitis TaxID=1652958 RepID=A0A916ZH61_9BACL|nr:DoxX family protein [Paenibacillus nasutitermitis]GGD97715.1 hypothetical protein GCM10010911_65610 [Paenibacillus nasutitermitis]